MSDAKEMEDRAAAEEGSSDSGNEGKTISSVEDAMPDAVGSPHKGQSGRAGSGQDAELQSVGQSQSDRAAGKSS